MRDALSVLLALTPTTVACSPSSQQADPAEAKASPQFDDWAGAFAEEWTRTSPQVATRTQYFAGDEQDALERQLSLTGEWGNIFGVTASRQRAVLATRGLEQLGQFDRRALTPSQALSAAVIEWWLKDTVKSAEFADHDFVFEQFDGLQLEYVNSLTQTHPIRHRRDVENYLEKLAQVAGRIDEGIAEARAADAAGIRPPRFIIERTRAQIGGLLESTGQANVFVVARLEGEMNTLLRQLG